MARLCDAMETRTLKGWSYTSPPGSEQSGDVGELADDLARSEACFLRPLRLRPCTITSSKKNLPTALAYARRSLRAASLINFPQPLIYDDRWRRFSYTASDAASAPSRIRCVFPAGDVRPPGRFSPSPGSLRMPLKETASGSKFCASCGWRSRPFSSSPLTRVVGTPPDDGTDLSS